MALKFYRKMGMVLACCFDGYILPEFVKTRFVVVISPKVLIRPKLLTVVSLSPTVPELGEPYHCPLQCLRLSLLAGFAKIALLPTVSAKTVFCEI